MVETPIRAEGMRAYPQGDLFLLTRGGDGFDALADNPSGRGPCPDEEFAAIDGVRMMRDLTDGAVVPLPDAGARHLSMAMLDADHVTNRVLRAPGRHRVEVAEHGEVLDHTWTFPAVQRDQQVMGSDRQPRNEVRPCPVRRCSSWRVTPMSKSPQRSSGLWRVRSRPRSCPARA